MGFVVRGLLVGSVLALARPLEAQVPAMAPAPAARFSVSPEYAYSVHAFNSLRAHSYRMFVARLEFRPLRSVSPWVSTGVIQCWTCAGSGWLSFAGMRVDLLREESRARVVPYGVAAVGALVRSRESAWVPSAGVGLRLRRAGDLAPRAEVRYERYDHAGYALLGLGINVLFTHRGSGGV